MKRREQGALDGLCGVYSIVNSISNVAGRKVTTNIEKTIFLSLAEELNKDGKLHEIIVDGISFRPLLKLIDIAIHIVEAETGIQIFKSVAWPRGKPTLNQFLERLETHINENKSGSCILGLGGKHNHWTCISTINEKSIRLIDSNGLRMLQRSKVTVGNSNSARLHELWPKQTILLSLTPK